ncbi:DUF1453 family protein [Paenibacillus sp. MER 180]|uniref:CcdC protein domain-containing protein n=1 Tax=Paenibacillus sp. MER 180 TaxID=2939570 RepID=UPI00203B55AA|nr:CcdC protein domain-containing protein [Paenibacillus sp. MER 180]MCM3290350.1 DUF1453 family protein [Paenibacillus sp. MER 180]
MTSASTFMIVLAIVLLRMGKEKELRPSRMWITPVLFIWVTFTTISQTANLTWMSFLLYAICLVLGIGLGMWRASLEKLRVHPVTGRITSQSSIAGVIIFMAAMLLRLAIGYWGREHALVSLSNALVMIPLGSVCARRFFLFLRYRQLQGHGRI